MVTTNILLSGNNFSKIALFFRYMNIDLVSPKTFRLMQSHYFIDSIKEFWEKKRAAIIDRLLAKDSVVALDKYGNALYKTAPENTCLGKINLSKRLRGKNNWAFFITVHEK